MRFASVVFLALLICCNGKNAERQRELELTERRNQEIKEMSRMLHQMAMMLEGELISIRHVRYKEILVTVEFTNRSDQEISSFEGGLRFKNKLENSFCKYEFKYYDSIAPQETVRAEYHLSTDSPRQGCRDLDAARISNVEFEFEVYILMLSNGERLDPSSLMKTP